MRCSKCDKDFDHVYDIEIVRISDSTGKDIMYNQLWLLHKTHTCYDCLGIPLKEILVIEGI